jgi:hypothetical protein
MKNKMFEKAVVTPDEMIGFNDPEISSIMKAQGVTRLPKTYKEFLVTMGKNAGKLWYPAVASGDNLGNFKQGAQNLLDIDGNPFELPADAFVFFMQEGLIFYYFLTENDDDDPPVYGYIEVEYVHEKVDEHLTDFLLNVY